MLIYWSPLEQFDLTFLNLNKNLFFLNNFYLILCILIIFVILFFLKFTNNYFNSVFLYNNKKFFLNFYNNIIKTELGPKNQDFYIFFFTLFIFLLLCNLFGMFSFGFTITSHISVTYTLSSIIFFGIIFFGLYLHGYKYWNVLVPSGAPKALLPFLIIIETISFVSRILSLAIRLFANMMSGHTLLYIIGTFCIYLFKLAGIFFILPFGLLIFILMLLEFFIAALQAYVFTVLSIIYIKDAYIGGH